MFVWIVTFTLLMAALMIVLEVLTPGRKWKKISGWWARAILFNLCQIAVVFIAGMAWDIWMQGKSLWQADKIFGTAGGAVVGYLVITFIYYWWHRARHDVDFLWRWFHQLHHSPERIEVITSFYKHPVELVANSILSSAILYMLVGLSPESASLAILMTGIAELFYHWNVRTPYWLGFFFQRPESHCVHHKRGWHRQNFSDLPLWDMVFGTFHNPKSFTAQCGFGSEKEKRVAEMLKGVNVNKARA